MFVITRSCHSIIEFEEKYVKTYECACKKHGRSFRRYSSSNLLVHSGPHSLRPLQLEPSVQRLNPKLQSCLCSPLREWLEFAYPQRSRNLNVRNEQWPNVCNQESNAHRLECGSLLDGSLRLDRGVNYIWSGRHKRCCHNVDSDGGG